MSQLIFRLLECVGNVIKAASSTSALPARKGARGPPTAKALPAASGTTTRASAATAWYQTLARRGFAV